MPKLKVHAALLLSIVFWASAFVGIRYGLSAYTPGSMALLRFLTASACMAGIYWYLPNKTPMPWADRLPLLLVGVACIGIYNVALNYGETTVSAGVASFLIGLVPVITAILSVLFLKEKLSRGAWTGIAISLFGLLLLTVGEKSQTAAGLGVLYILIAVLAGAVYHIYSKHFLSRYHPIEVTAWIMWGGTLLLLVFTPKLMQEIFTADLRATMTVIYMGIFPAALAYLAWSYVLNYLPASTASATLFSLPLVATGMGFVLLHEKPAFISVLGGILALLGAIYTVQKR